MLNDAGVAVTAGDEELTVQVTETAEPLVNVTTTFGLGVTLLPETTEPLDGLHATEKSKPAATLKVTVVVRDCPLFVPVTTTVKTPLDAKVHDNVTVALGGRVTLAGIVQATLLDDNVTIPLKAGEDEPPTVTCEVRALPATPDTDDGVALNAKSATLKVTVVVRD